MMIAHHQLQQARYETTLYHEKADLLIPLFPNRKICFPEESLDADLILVLNDNSKRAWELLRNRRKYPALRFLFPTPCKAMQPQDYLFDSKTPVATNLQNALSHILQKKVGRENGIALPQGTFRKNKKQIVIHPTSADIKRNWLPKQFVELARRLQKKGFTISFATSPDERPYWEFVEEEGISLPYFANLHETAAHIYESGALIGNDSGIGHLASNLGIPTFTISGNKKRVLLWRPDFTINEIATLPFPLPNFKGMGFRMRENCWQAFLPVRVVTKKFLKFYETCCAHSL